MSYAMYLISIVCSFKGQQLCPKILLKLSVWKQILKPFGKEVLKRETGI